MESVQSLSTGDIVKGGLAFLVVSLVLIIIGATGNFGPGIGTRLIVSGVVIIIITLFFQYLLMSSTAVPAADGTAESIGSKIFRIFPPITGSISNGFRIIYYFLPYLFFTFGFMVDLISDRVQFLPAGITGFLTCVLNFLISKFIYSDSTDRDLCGIPGLSALGSKLAPQSALFNITTLSHIAAYITMRQGFFGVNAVWPAWVAVVSLGFLQTAVLLYTECIERDWIGAVRMVSTAAAGIIAGTIGAAVTHAMISDPGNSSGGLLSSTSGSVAPKSLNSTDAGTCSAPNDQDQFVCEAYKNGQLVTSTIVE